MLAHSMSRGRFSRANDRGRFSDNESTLPPPGPCAAPKGCRSCGAVYGPVEWRFLECVGLQSDLQGGWLELRNCTCGSTLAVEVE
jgi:hypothetical protein